MFELNSLNSDERELEKIYVRQLESVLFSINQSVQDKVSEITTGLERNMNSMSDDMLLEDLSSYNFFEGVYLTGLDTPFQSFLSEDRGVDAFANKADSIFKANTSVVSRLRCYKEGGGFMKIEMAYPTL